MKSRSVTVTEANSDVNPTALQNFSCWVSFLTYFVSEVAMANDDEDEELENNL